MALKIELRGFLNFASILISASCGACCTYYTSQVSEHFHFINRITFQGHKLVY